jgi:hypothetical protein
VFYLRCGWRRKYFLVESVLTRLTYSFHHVAGLLSNC